MSYENTQGITILGLGPGAAGQVTCQAWDCLNSAEEIYLRTVQHPTVSTFPASLRVHSFDDLYEKATDFNSVYSEIIRTIIELGKRPQGVIYAVPGHPFVAETTGPEIVRLAKEMGLPVKVIDGLSFIEPVCTALGIDPFPQMLLVDALDLGRLNHPNFPPSMPVLVTQIYSRQVASEIKLTLTAVYPDEYPVRLVHAAGTDQELVEDLRLYEIDRSGSVGLMTVLYIPPMPDSTSFEEFQEIIAHLRAPDGCPWDREQTHASLRTSLLEETYETLDALDRGDSSDMKEEFGDLLLQIVLNAQIASEDGEFAMADVVQGIYEKIVRRHPHVFGEVKLKSVGDVLQNWEKLKAAERKENGEGHKGPLDGVAKAYPALAQAQAYQERAARIGIGDADVDAMMERVFSEIRKVKGNTDPEEITSSIGELLFAIVKIARFNKVDAESALRQANQRFRIMVDANKP